MWGLLLWATDAITTDRVHACVPSNSAICHRWSVELLGFVDLDDLSGIRALGHASHADFCHADGHEFPGRGAVTTDGGVDGAAAGVCFWDDDPSVLRSHKCKGSACVERRRVMSARVATLEELFFAKYPEQGKDRPPPTCPFE